MLDDPKDYDLIKKKTKNMGFGIFTTRSFKKGEFVAPYSFMKNQVYSLSTFNDKYGKNYLHTYRDQRHHRIISVKDNRNIASFINEDRQNPNVEFKAFKVFAKRNIKKGEQLFLRYFYKWEY